MQSRVDGVALQQRDDGVDRLLHAAGRRIGFAAPGPSCPGRAQTGAARVHACDGARLGQLQAPRCRARPGDAAGADRRGEEGDDPGRSSCADRSGRTAAGMTYAPVACNFGSIACSRNCPTSSAMRCASQRAGTRQDRFPPDRPARRAWGAHGEEPRIRRPRPMPAQLHRRRRRHLAAAAVDRRAGPRGVAGAAGRGCATRRRRSRSCTPSSVGLPPGDGALAEGALDAETTEGAGYSGRAQFVPAARAGCRPIRRPGHGVHRYAFQLFALAGPARVLRHAGPRGGARGTREQAIASGCLIGTYERPDGSIKDGDETRRRRSSRRRPRLTLRVPR